MRVFVPGVQFAATMIDMYLSRATVSAIRSHQIGSTSQSTTSWARKYQRDNDVQVSGSQGY